MVLRCPGPPRSHKKRRNAQKSLKIMKCSEISLNLVKSWNLIEFKQLGCPESLEFHRKYNHSSTGPPKYQILVEFTKKSLNFITSGRFSLKIIKMQNIQFLMIRAVSGDSCEDLPLLSLCNLLCFIRPGQVVRGQRARRGICAISKKFAENMENL